MRTFKGDIEEILKREKKSLAEIALEEERKRRENLAYDKNLPEKASLARNTLFITLILLAAGVIILGTLWFFLNKKAPTLNNPGTSILINVESSKEADVTNFNRKSLIDFLVKERKQENVARGTLKILSFVTTGESGEKEILSAENFMSILDAEMPPSLIRALEPNFLFGFYGESANQPFLVFKTANYRETFFSMLEWENIMENKIGEIFFNPSLRRGILAATSTKEITTGTKNFQDEVLRSRDSRTLTGDKKELLFFYSFPDENTLILTTSENAFQTLAKRLLKAK